MFSTPKQRQLRTAFINGRKVDVGADETLLHAALREGLPFPNSCRVGCCGSCKCRLVSGDVRETTETGYLLSDEEMDRNFILACQSKLLSNVVIDVDMIESTARLSVRGSVIGQTRLTHDITQLDIQLETPLDYRAGQYAELCFQSLPETTRSYSFANAPDPTGRISFFIRKVKDGKVSNLVDAEDLVGQTVRVEGPSGTFWLREGSGSIILVAGGSGLAPVLALLEDALRAGVERPATLIFGAREKRDLYALERIADLAARWPEYFRFVPVLSALDPAEVWSGERGNVSDVIPKYLGDAETAYLCGPPAMVDAATQVLMMRGMSGKDIVADRFVTQAAPAASIAALELEKKSRSAQATLLDYVKFLPFQLLAMATTAAIMAGSVYTTLGFLAILAYFVFGDLIAGDDLSTPRYGKPSILTAQLWMALPLLCLVMFSAAWSVSSGDLWGYGAWVTSWSGYDVLAARAETTFLQHVSASVMVGILTGVIGTVVGHELTHRTWDPISLLIGRWLLAFSFDASFAIEHVYGHHRYVATVHDPATAPRGRNVYHHIVASTLKGNLSAWNIEARRLQRQHLAVLSRHNACIRGYLMSVAILAAAGLIGGWWAIVFIVASGLIAKAELEVVNFMEHYGIVRVPSRPVEPRHSWNTNRRISSWSLFNLTRHSHHHAQGEVPFQDLMPIQEAPTMIAGYLTTILIALVPPLWNGLMVPKIIAWDEHYASPEERILARKANLESGLPALMARGEP